MAAPEAPIKTVADEKSLAQAAAAAVQSSDEALLAKMGYKQARRGAAWPFALSLIRSRLTPSRPAGAEARPESCVALQLGAVGTRVAWAPPVPWPRLRMPVPLLSQPLLPHQSHAAAARRRAWLRMPRAAARGCVRLAFGRLQLPLPPRFVVTTRHHVRRLTPALPLSSQCLPILAPRSRVRSAGRVSRSL